ncbi:LytR C-terminal domain-containing protein [Euzebya rosea]|uniref:LytR C-terminal domain-containing protein n=1 Tax=Euzebya rosea TaxID=2052804 RepID=UPI000D3E9139|nr:LytR C-terminal domain-containing protein [Euzebya rosea]
MDGFDDGPAEPGTSIAAPLIRALLAAALAFGVYWLVFQPDPVDEMALSSTPTPDVVATVPAEPSTAASVPDIVSTPTPLPSLTDAEPLPGDGVSAQLLNGTDDQEKFDDVVQTLVDLGYDVTQSGRARNDYAETTIFATAGQEEAAAALVAADPRFTTIGDNPGNLTTEIDIHIVVGDDWTVTESAPEAGATEG